MKWTIELVIFSLFLSQALAAPKSTPKITNDINCVQSELNKKKFTTIESFLADMPSDYRSTFTLVYASNSLQQATPLEPRVIEYGDDASLVIAFNSGDANLKGSDTVELIQFDPAQSSFQFYEISKSTKTGLLALTQETSKCMACHRSDPRPNWQPYDNWPGAYGSNEDQLDSTPPEQTDYVDFLKTVSSNSRYSTLTGLPASSPSAEPSGTPNALLVDRLAQWNYMRAARLVIASRDYASYKYAILASGACRDQFAEFFPASNPLPSNYNQSRYQDPWIAEFLYIFNSRNIAWQDWTMTIDGVQSVFFDNNPFIAGYTYGEDLIADVVKQDAELQAYAQVTENQNYDNVTGRSVSVSDCDALAKLSVQALGKL